MTEPSKTPRTDALIPHGMILDEDGPKLAKLCRELESDFSDTRSELDEARRYRAHGACIMAGCQFISESKRADAMRTYAESVANAARAWDASLSAYCDGPERDALRALLAKSTGGSDKGDQSSVVAASGAVSPPPSCENAIGTVRDRIEALMQEYRLQHHPKLAKDIEALFMENSLGPFTPENFGLDESGLCGACGKRVAPDLRGEPETSQWPRGGWCDCTTYCIGRNVDRGGTVRSECQGLPHIVPAQDSHGEKP